MATFKDKHGREWHLLIEVPHLKPLREQWQFEPARAYQTNAAAELLTDPERMVGVLATLCEEQIVKAGVTPEQFGRSFDGPAFASAYKGLVEAIADFSPLSKAAKTAAAGLLSHFDRMEEKATAAVEKALTELASNDSAGNSSAPAA